MGVSMTRTVMLDGEPELELLLVILLSLEGVVNSAHEALRLPSTGDPEISPLSFRADSSLGVRGECREPVSVVMIAMTE